MVVMIMWWSYSAADDACGDSDDASAADGCNGGVHSCSLVHV